MMTGPTISMESETPVAPFERFFRRLTQGSYPLFAAAIADMIWANLSAHHYHDFWHAEMAIAIGSNALTKSIAHWIDEALMAMFFFVVGLEIKRELLVGGLSTSTRWQKEEAKTPKGGTDRR